MLKKWKQVYKNMPIRKKIISVFAAVFVFFILLVLFFSNVILYHSNITKIQRNIQDECDMINLQISNLYDTLRICQNSTIQGINQAYQKLETGETDQISFVSMKNSLLSVLNYYKGCFGAVDSLVFVDTRNNVVSTGADEISYGDIEGLLKEIPSFGPVNTVTFPVECTKAFGGSKEEGILTQGKRIINIDTGDNLGWLFVNVKTGTIAENFPGDTGEAYRKKYSMVDNRNRIVVTGNPKELLTKVDDAFMEEVSAHGAGSFRTTTEKEEYLVTSRTNHQFGWTIINEIPIGDIMKDIYVISITIIVIGLVCAGLAMAFILVLSRIITNPIKALTETATEISDGNLSRRCVVDCQDEVGVLAGTFNRMLERIANLLIQVKEEQKKKRETELALFQVQIKPHFLYNTLDLIYVCCEMEDGPTAGKIAKALADYYRTCLSGGEEVVSVGKELKNTENYLFIQKERYSDIITYEMEIPDNCRGYKIPKMTLQPLVENAIYHGLKEKDEEGCISIRVTDHEDSLLLEVEDDGVGMDADTFEELLHRKEEQGKKHFGMKNVHERIQLYFGEEYGLSIKKEKKQGTCIQIRIPKIEAYDD